MAGRFKKVAGGDRLEIPAATYNAFIDAAEAHAASQSSQESDSGVRRDPSNDLILVLNSSGASRNRSEILGIQSPLVLPTKNLNEFQNRLGVIGVTPAIGTHAGKFVVLAEPIPKDGIGWCWVSGACPARVLVSDTDPPGGVIVSPSRADIETGVTSYLKGGGGAIQILWIEPGPGIKWAIVRFGSTATGGGSSTFAVVRETYPAPSKVVLVQEVTVDESGVSVITGEAVPIRVWPGLLSENYAALRWVGDLQPATIVISVSQIGSQSYAEQWSGLRYRLLKRPRNVRVTDCLPVEAQY